MKKDSFKTDVVFFTEADGEILAVLGSKQRNGLFACYSHIGQHNSASEGYLKEQCTPIPADKDELFKDLFTELEGLGYNLRVKSSIRFN